MIPLIGTGLLVLAGIAAYILWRRRPKEETYKDPEKASIEFCRSAMDYYVAGRFSALTGKSIIVSGNILHHAIEMLLKGALCMKRSHSRQQIRSMGHNLKRAWKAFKKTFPDPRLNALDSAVKDLNKFEDLRYPDKLMSSGMEGMFILKREHVKDSYVSAPKGSMLSKYSYIMEDVDELVKLIFEVGGINPKFFPLYSDALTILQKENDHPVL
jgi:hypothetical protein